jgi:PKD repeat protein
MIRAPTFRVSGTRRMIQGAVVIPLFAVALMGLLAPTAAGAPVAPYFGPAGIVDRPPAYSATTPSLAVGSDGVAYLAFAGWGGAATQSDIFFTKSSDGRTWSVPIRVNNDAGPATQSEPALALDSTNAIDIAWTDTRNGNNDVFFAKSTDGGLSFSANVRVNDVTTNSQSEPALAVDPLNPHLIHVVWTDTRSPILGADIYYANSTDGGLSFNPSLRVNNDLTGAEQGEPAIAVAPNEDVYVVWRDPRNPAKGPDIYFSKSFDRGATWTPNFNLNDDIGGATQQDPTIAVDAVGTIYVAWTDFRNPNTAPDIYATRSTNAGASFAANVKVNDDVGAALQWAPDLAANAGRVQAVWADSRTSGSTSWDIYGSSSTDGLTWSPNVKVNDDSLPNDFQFWPSVGIDLVGDVFAAWLDSRVSGQDVFASVLDVISPSANAGAAISVGQGAIVSFNGTGSSDNLGIASYAWEFGDGSSGTGVSTTHAYPTPGTYTATLTVWDYSGNSASATRIVTVRDTQAPVPRGGGDRTVDEGQPLFFDASASTDNVGVTSYAWNFGDNSSATTATATHVYSSPGKYAASLTVKDAAGNSATSTFTVTVRAVSPKPAELLGMIQILDVIVAILAVALAVLGWMYFGLRRRERQPPAMPMSVRPPDQPPAQPPREPDPLDMTLPPPKGP